MSGNGKSNSVLGKHMRSAFIPHAPVQVYTGADSLTRQEFVDECDVNVLMARYEHNPWPLLDMNKEPQYLDLTDVPDFPTAMQLIINANEAFMSLPAAVRKEFDNDPGKFVAFAQNPDNIERMREWKLAPPAVKEAPPLKVEVVGAVAPPVAPAGAPGGALPPGSAPKS